MEDQTVLSQDSILIPIDSATELSVFQSLVEMMETRLAVHADTVEDDKVSLERTDLSRNSRHGLMYKIEEREGLMKVK